MQLTISCKIDDYHCKDKDGGSLILKLSGNKDNLDGYQWETLADLVGKRLEVTFRRKVPDYNFITENTEKKKKKAGDDEDQLTFLSVQCPDCGGYDCQVADTLAICNTCRKEFALPPEVRKIREEQVFDLIEIGKEIYTAKTAEGAEGVEWEEFLTWVEGLINKTLVTSFPEDIEDERVAEGVKDVLSTLTQADFETIINHYNLLVQAEQTEEPKGQAEEQSSAEGVEGDQVEAVSVEF